MAKTPEPEDKPSTSDIFPATEQVKALEAMIVRQDPPLQVARYVLANRAVFDEHLEMVDYFKEPANEAQLIKTLDDTLPADPPD